MNTNSTQTNALPSNTLELKDIHVPEQITNFPIAYGWWILAALLILTIVITIVKIKKSAKRNQVKKQALAQLKNNSDINNSELISLLKWAAMHYFSRVELAKLYGESLLEFFLKQLPEKHQTRFTELSAEAFKNQYQANFDKQVDTDFQQAARLWLTQALPPTPQIVAKTKETNSNQNNKGVNA
jgi:hypothetical protein